MSTNKRRWWNDEHHKIHLNEKVCNGNWFVKTPHLLGKVIQVIYAGYKIEMPDGRLENINPDQCQVDDLTSEEFHEQEVVWSIRNKAEQEATEKLKASASAHERDIKLKQMACLHPTTQENEVLRAAGCDISDTHCTVCMKVLRRSWSTAYDRDPNDHISDWAWWLREYKRLYSPHVPSVTDYEIVDKISF
jgi:hypothetical protein